MFGRLRLGFCLLLATGAGYWLGNGPFSEWVEDVYHMLAVGWRGERLARGSNGLISLLVAGYLLGQGVYLLVRQVIGRVGPARIRLAEKIAAWDPSLKLGTRFGLHRYLENCVKWAAEDPTARTQSLALFKVRGLGALNEKRGTLATTRLLQRIADDVRGASLPEASSAIRRWLTHYLPRPVDTSAGTVMPPRFPARWTGSTFALAFRELDAVQAVTIARELAGWIRSELEALGTPSASLSASIAIAVPSVTARGLATAALKGLSETKGGLITVVHDPADVRATVVQQMSDVDHITTEFPRYDVDAIRASAGGEEPRSLRKWVHAWGPALGCFAGAVVWLQVTGGKGVPPSNAFAWPDSLEQVQVVDASGPRAVHLMRQTLPPQASSNWQLTDIKIIQGNPADGDFFACQIHATITNQSRHSFYASALDFAAYDANGRAFEFEPMRTLRFEKGIAGRWLSPGESWSGWLIMYRGKAPVVQLVFEPDRATRLVSRVNAG